MYKSCKYLIPLIFTTISAFVVTPSQAQTPVESSNINSLSSQLSTDSEKTVPDNSSELKNSPNQKPDVLSENTTNPNSTGVTTTTTTSNPRIPISSRIFAVPSMQQ